MSAPVTLPARLLRPKSTQIMVDSALKSLNDRNGSSLSAVKKFIAATYEIDIEASLKRIKKYIKESIESGKFAQTKGKGISGSFKISPKFKEPAKPKMMRMKMGMQRRPTIQMGRIEVAVQVPPMK